MPDNLTDLISQVHDRADTADPAGLLDAAAAISAEHAADADRLLDHFVGHARGTGMSWTEIGAYLGVTKQAARQRFAAPPPPFAARTAPSLRACLDRAAHEARTDGAAEIGTQHLLTGLLAEGAAAEILERLGVRAEQMRTVSHRLFGPPAAAPGSDIPPMSTDAARALDAAAHNAAAHNAGADTRDAAPPEVRPEHLLGVLALDPGSRARRILKELHVDVAAVKRELQCLITVSPARPARWWKRRPAAAQTCTFCGRTTEPSLLVNGPGVTICRSCVALAADILAGRPHNGGPA